MCHLHFDRGIVHSIFTDCPVASYPIFLRVVELFMAVMWFGCDGGIHVPHLEIQGSIFAVHVSMYGLVGLDLYPRSRPYHSLSGPTSHDVGWSILHRRCPILCPKQQYVVTCICIAWFFKFTICPHLDMCAHSDHGLSASSRSLTFYQRFGSRHMACICVGR